MNQNKIVAILLSIIGLAGIALLISNAHYGGTSPSPVPSDTPIAKTEDDTTPDPELAAIRARVAKLVAEDDKKNAHNPVFHSTKKLQVLSIIGKSKETIIEQLGKPKSVEGQFITFKPVGFDDVQIKMVNGKADSITGWLTQGKDSSTQVLAFVGVDMTIPPDQKAPIADWWHGYKGLSKIGALRDTNHTGWDCIQVFKSE